MKIALGADHGGYHLKEDLKKLLAKQGYEPLDLGTHSSEPCDYPSFAYKVAKTVSDKKASLGILICRSGNGMAIAANKLPGIRAAICQDKQTSVLSRQHNDANVLVLGAEHLFDDPEAIVHAWLGADFEGGRHERRVHQILEIEKKIGVSKVSAKAAPRKSTQPSKRSKKGKKR